MTCIKCGSDKVKVLSTEMAFGGGTQFPPVYALAAPVCCLDCGFAEFSIPQDSLNELRQHAVAQPLRMDRPSNKAVA
jgi:hypothetical protein